MIREYLTYTLLDWALAICPDRDRASLQRAFAEHASRLEP